MENLTLAMLNQAKAQLTGTIFTARQLEVLQKKIQEKPLNTTEKSYYYKFIKPKVEAMQTLYGISPYTIKGKEYILSQRIDPALKILNQMKQKHKNQKILLTGSFLFQLDYNDIDIFIFSKYHKEDYHWKKVQVIFFPESALNSLFFCSVQQISISNFTFDIPSKFHFKLVDLLKAYELVVNEILGKEDYQKTLRTFILLSEYLSKEVILNPQQLYHLKKKFMGKNNLKFLSRYFIDSLLLSFSKSELALLNQEVKDYSKLQEEYKNSPNLPIYIETYKEVMGLAG